MYKMEQLTTYDDNLDEIQCGHLTCDEISTLRLNDVLKESGKYIFQTKMKSKTSSAVVLSITNQECTFNTTPTWQRFVNKFDSIDTQIAGLGEIKAIQDLYVAHTADAINE